MTSGGLAWGWAVALPVLFSSAVESSVKHHHHHPWVSSCSFVCPHPQHTSHAPPPRLARKPHTCMATLTYAYTSCSGLWPLFQNRKKNDAALSKPTLILPSPPSLPTSTSPHYVGTQDNDPPAGPAPGSNGLVRLESGGGLTYRW